MIIIFCMIAFFCILFISLWRLSVGVAAVLALLPSYLVRSSIFGIPTTLLELSIYALALAFFIKKIISQTNHTNAHESHEFTNHQLSIINYPFTKPLLLLFVAGIISIFVSPDLQAAFGVFKAYFFDAILFYFLIVNIIKSPSKQITPMCANRTNLKDSSLNANYQSLIPYALTGIALSGLVVALTAIFQYIFHIGLTYDGKALAMFNTPNAVALFLAPLTVLFGILGIEVYGKSRKISICYLLLAICFMTAVLLSFSRGGLLAVVCTLVIYFIWKAFKRCRIKSQPHKIRTLQIITKSIWTFVFVGSLLLLIVAFFPRAARDVGDPLRLKLWSTASAMLKDHPIQGVGLSGFRQTVAPYFAKANGWPTLPDIQTISMYPHNIILNFWSETGLLGLIAIVWLCFKIFRNKLITPARQSYAGVAGGHHSSLVTATKFAFLAILLHGFVDVPFFKNDLSILFITFLGFLL